MRGKINNFYLTEKYMTRTLEKSVISKFNETFGFSVRKTADQYCPIDGLCRENKVLLEIKTQKQNFDDFHTCVIGKDKIDYCRRKYPDWTLYVVWTYDDQSVVYQWNKLDNHFLHPRFGNKKYGFKPHYMVSNNCVKSF